MVVVMLLMYSVLHCLYSVGNKITTTATSCYFWKLKVCLWLQLIAPTPCQGKYILQVPNPIISHTSYWIAHLARTHQPLEVIIAWGWEPITTIRAAISANSLQIPYISCQNECWNDDALASYMTKQTCHCQDEFPDRECLHLFCLPVRKHYETEKWIFIKFSDVWNMTQEQSGTFLFHHLETGFFSGVINIC